MYLRSAATLLHEPHHRDQITHRRNQNKSARAPRLERTTTIRKLYKLNAKLQKTSTNAALVSGVCTSRKGSDDHLYIVRERACLLRVRGSGSLPSKRN